MSTIESLMGIDPMPSPKAVAIEWNPDNADYFKK